MENSKHQSHPHDEDDYTESEGSVSDYDSDKDPSYSIIEETGKKLSNLSIKKKSTSRAKNLGLSVEKDSEEVDVDDDDEESHVKVQNFVEGGKIEKLNICQCKAYLRRNGLRLSGNKDILIQRIKEHQQLLKCGGEEKYPQSSFVLNCKGDACKGDVVLFEQNVYEMYNIAARSSGGPPCGKRLVAGRIVKESYGTAKQQHTFTIEVLWSKGKMPLPPLHQLLIKGRNLYRLRTQRQMWENEEERCKVLMEKHSRGSLARSNREARTQEKVKKLPRGLRAQGKKDPENCLSGNQQVQTHQSRPALGNLGDQMRNSVICLDVEKPTVQAQDTSTHIAAMNMGISAQLQPSSFLAQKSHRETDNLNRVTYGLVKLNNHELEKHSADGVNNGNYAFHEQCMAWKNGISGPHHPRNRPLHSQPVRTVNNQQPLRGMNHNHLTNPLHGQGYQKLQLCRYYSQGRCYYGDNCRFLHESREANSLKREQRW